MGYHQIILIILLEEGRKYLVMSRYGIKALAYCKRLYDCQYAGHYSSKVSSERKKNL